MCSKQGLCVGVCVVVFNTHVCIEYLTIFVRCFGGTMVTYTSHQMYLYTWQ